MRNLGLGYRIIAARSTSFRETNISNLPIGIFKPVRKSRTFFRQFSTFNRFQVDSYVIISDNYGIQIVSAESKKPINVLIIDRLDFQ